MDVKNEQQEHNAIKSPLAFILILVVATVGLALWFKYHRPSHPPEIAQKRQCLANLRQLGLAMHLYAHENEQKFPPAATWCDALVKADPNVAEYLRCPAAVAAGDENRCHYSMNPNVVFGGESNVVLLFTSKGGWNQHSGRELMVTDRFAEPGCCIVMADGAAMFTKADALDTLNWGRPKEQTMTSEKEQEMAKLKVGDKAPKFTLIDQDGAKVSLSDFAGKKVLVYFYPKVDTPGCTKQSCSVRDATADLKKLGVVALGISPDKPEAQKKFDDKYTLGFRLLSDPDHKVAEAYGAWGEKKMYGKTSMGTIRSSFLIDEAGKLIQVSYKVKPDATVPEAMAVIQDVGE